MTSLYDQHPLEPNPRPGVQPALWLIYLFVQPYRFFANMPRLVTSYTLVYASYLYGVASAIDRLDLELARMDIGGRARPLAEFVSGSWGRYWGVALGTGLIGAIMYYAVGGWWYKTRIKWCGVADPDPHEARRVYVFASLVWALPAVLLAVTDSLRSASPVTSEAGWLSLGLGLAALFWSYYVSYRGTRTAFGTSRWLARLWFLILPALLQTAALVVMVLLVVFTGLISGTSEVHVRNPATVSRAGFELQHPANWWTEFEIDGEDNVFEFSVDSPLDAVARIIIDDIPEDPQEALARELEFSREYFPGTEGQPVLTWGSVTGAGWEYIGTYDGTRYRVRVFCASTEKHSLVVAEYCAEDVFESERLGFDLLRDSFRFRSDAP